MNHHSTHEEDKHTIKSRNKKRAKTNYGDFSHLRFDAPYHSRSHKRFLVQDFSNSEVSKFNKDKGV